MFKRMYNMELRLTIGQNTIYGPLKSGGPNLALTNKVVSIVFSVSNLDI